MANVEAARIALIISVVLFFPGASTAAAPSQETCSLSGTVSYAGEAAGPVLIRLHRLEGGVTLEKAYGTEQAFRELKLSAPGEFRFKDLPADEYFAAAFIDLDGDGELDFDPSEPYGWYATDDHLVFAAIDLSQGDVDDVEILLRTPSRFPAAEKQIDNGALRRIKGLPVLQLWGTAEERGFAHGYLVGRQIIDFFEFYILENMVRSVAKYEDFYVPFFESRFGLPPEFEREMYAVIAGMKASGIDMCVRLLGRDFNRTDLLAINAYIERRAAKAVEPVSTKECSQFAFWGAQTEGSELRGGLIAGRNMDGEIDLRKVTVSHFLTFAVDPAEPGRKRWVSTMWPGFVGTISGINEDGLYSMENAGPSGPGPVVGGIVPCSWVQRYALENAGAEATPESVSALMGRFRCGGGGVTAAGSVILWAVPFDGQEAPAFIYEGDRNGGLMRLPAQVRPTAPTNIMGTNHYRVYGVGDKGPGYNFGRSIFCWRYAAGLAALEAWDRVGRPVGIEEMKQLLQTVARGTTEYSVIFLANEKRILIAVDDLKPDRWDAPYLEWHEYRFDELFER